MREPGKTKDQPYIIDEPSISEGQFKETKIIRALYGLKEIDWDLISEDLVSEDNLKYDHVIIRLKNNQKIDLWFNMTTCYDNEIE